MFKTHMHVLITLFRAFDNGLNSKQIIIYARIPEHTCRYCIIIYARIPEHTCRYCIINLLSLIFNGLNSILLINYARIKHTSSYVLTCFCSFDNGLNSKQIVIYARITEHTCSNCINFFAFI